MAITLDQCKKNMVLCVVDFFERWGHWPTKGELFTMAKSIPEHKGITKFIFSLELRSLIEDWQLLALCGKRICATENAKKRLSISENGE